MLTVGKECFPAVWTVVLFSVIKLALNARREVRLGRKE